MVIFQRNALTTFEYMNETHKKCAQLLTVECVLLLGNVNFNMSRRDVIQQHSYKLHQESKSQGLKKGFNDKKKNSSIRRVLKDSPTPTWQMSPQAGTFVPPHLVPGCLQVDHLVRGSVAEGALSCGRRGDVGKGRARGSGTGQCPQWTETQALGGLPKYPTPTVGL